MSRNTIKFSYAKSLLWIALFIALASGTALIIGLVVVDFIHGNSNRSQGNALFMIFAYPPITGIVSAIGALLVFTLPQAIQAVATYILVPKIGRISFVVVLLMLPATAWVTWYCYDYLTPSNVGLAINDGPDWVPYQHGITLQRYVIALAAQAIVTVFSILYCDASIRSVSTKTLIFGALALTLVAGGIWGDRIAESQFQFIDPSRSSVGVTQNLFLSCSVCGSIVK